MATNKTRKRLSTILHTEVSAASLSVPTVAEAAVLGVEEQMLLMETRKEELGSREDPRFPDVWVKGNGLVIPVAGMSLDHMCMAIAFWLQGEFEDQESETLGLSLAPAAGAIAKISPYATPEAWLTLSASFQTTPALTTMLKRLQGMKGGMDKLHEILQQRAAESLANAHSVPEHYLFNTPSFF